jgi:transcriptional regulator GlxA family with amidase domain
MIHVSLVTTPEVVVSSLTGPYDVFSFFNGIAPHEQGFKPELVGLTHEPLRTANGLPVTPHRTFDEIDHTDIVYIPSLHVLERGWQTGQYPQIVDWMRRMYDQGARLCAACTGGLLLAETGLLAGREATIHWVAEEMFRKNFPDVALKLEHVLIATGPEGRIMMSGASGAWNDLVLYLITREIGPAAAQTVSKFFLLQWHPDGQTPYLRFQENLNHTDGAIRGAQAWLSTNYTRPHALEEAARESGLAERTFKRRFGKATGYAPIAYVQNLRVEEAKRLLEQTATPVDDVSWQVGYEDPAFFRRLFKRVTGITPSAYRRKFQIPQVYQTAAE